MERYRGVEFLDLKAGLMHLDAEVSRRSVGTTSFIKGHVGSFIQCYDVLTDILTCLLSLLDCSQSDMTIVLYICTDMHVLYCKRVLICMYCTVHMCSHACIVL